MRERPLRLWTGLIVTAFVVPHLINHALGLISLQTMDSVREVLLAPWQSIPGLIALYGSLALHFLLSLKSIYLRATLKMPLWEAAQIALGLFVIPLLTIHVVGTRVAFELFDVSSDYQSVLGAIWSNNRYIIQQIALIAVVWIHVVIGLHFWLRLKAWYHRAIPYLYALSLLIPVLALLGFYRAGQQVQQMLTEPGGAEFVFAEWIRAGDDARNATLALEPRILIGYGVVLALVLVARRIRTFTNRSHQYRIQHPRAGVLAAPLGSSILEGLRSAGVAHASVCGGRGRCTTCRIRVGSGLEALPAPSELEQHALERIHADPNVRLACQTYPNTDVDITPLLPAKTSPEYVYRPGGVSGREQRVAAMFIDLRGSTGIGEARLPYDVVFILNQFFSEMSNALEATNGHYAQFSGDGLMALYGLDVGLAEGCRDAMQGAVEMARRMADLNHRLSDELAEPLKIGIGIHCGEAIVGTMGPPKSPNFSAIGDNINIAARLEAQTKELGGMLIVSEEVALASGANLSEYALRDVPIRGRGQPVRVYVIDDPLALTGL